MGSKPHAAKGETITPLRVLWGVVLLTIALRHTGFEACLGELRRNPSLANLIGIKSVAEIPQGWNVSRFLDVLGQEPHLGELQGTFNQIIQRLGEVVPDLGQNTAGDSTALKARLRRRDRPKASVGVAAGKGGKEDVIAAEAGGDGPGKITYDECGLPQPSGGRKEYKDDQGKVTRVFQWFGYKLHLLVDVKHEVALVWRVSSTKAGDNEILPALVDEGRANLPPRRIRMLAYDKAAA